MSRVDLLLLAEARATGRLDAETWRRAVEQLGTSPPAQIWRRLLDRGALIGGVSLVVAGLIYLVAWNWSELGYLTKLSLAAGVLIVVGAAGIWLGAERLSGRLAMGSAGVLTGSLLVVYSQAYQTGADPWQLFATWALLLLPWALAARLQGIWLFFFVLVELAIGAAWLQRSLWSSVVWGDPALLCCTLSLVNVAVLGLHEALATARRRRDPHARPGRIVPRVACIAAFAFALFPALAALERSEPLATDWLAYAGVYAAVVAIQALYWLRGRDPAIVAVALAACITLSTVTLFELLHHGLDLDPILTTPLIGLALVAQAIGSIAWVRLGQLWLHDETHRRQLLRQLEQEGVTWG